LQVSQDEPRGVVLFAQDSISEPIACALAAERIPVLVVVAEAESPPTGTQPFDVYSGDIYSEGFDAALTTADVGTAVIVASDRGHEIHARERCLRQMDSRSIFIVPREKHSIRSGWRSLSESSPPRGLIPFFPEITRDALVGIASRGEPAWIDPEAGQWPIPQGATPLFLVVDGDHAVVSTPRAMARSLRGRNQAIEPRLLVWTAPSQATSSGQQESPA